MTLTNSFIAALEDEPAFDVAVEANENGEGEGDRLLSSH